MSVETGTYAIRHMGETIWLAGAVAVARWLCDNYGLPLSRMPCLVGRIGATPKLQNSDLGLCILRMDAAHTRL